MDKLTNYRMLIKRYLSHVQCLVNRQPTPGVETVCVFDEERDQYLLMRIGWTADRRVRHITLYVRIRNGKILIEEDWTEYGIATELLKAGVPTHDIVLGFQPPEMRTLTEFAVA
jgi:hypothetical protein